MAHGATDARGPAGGSGIAGVGTVASARSAHVRGRERRAEVGQEADDAVAGAELDASVARRAAGAIAVLGAAVGLTRALALGLIADETGGTRRVAAAHEEQKAGEGDTPAAEGSAHSGATLS